MSEKKYKVALVRVYSHYNYLSDEYTEGVKDNFQWVEVTEKQYKALQDNRVRQEILKHKYDDYDQYNDKLLMIEDRTVDLEKIIADSESIVQQIQVKLAKEEAERQAKLKKQAEKRKKTKELKAKAAKEKELERARKLLQESGEL